LKGFERVNLDLFDKPKPKLALRVITPTEIDDSDLEIKIPDYSKARSTRERHLMAMAFVYQNRVFLDILEEERGIKYETTQT